MRIPLDEVIVISQVVTQKTFKNAIPCEDHRLEVSGFVNARVNRISPRERVHGVEETINKGIEVTL